MEKTNLKLTYQVLISCYKNRDLKTLKSHITSYAEYIRTRCVESDESSSSRLDYYISCVLVYAWYKHWDQCGFDKAPPPILQSISNIYPISLLSEKEYTRFEQDGLFFKHQYPKYPNEFGADAPVMLPWISNSTFTDDTEFFLWKLSPKYKDIMLCHLIKLIDSSFLIFNRPLHKLVTHIKTNELWYNLNVSADYCKSVFEDLAKFPRTFADKLISLPIDYLFDHENELMGNYNLVDLDKEWTQLNDLYDKHDPLTKQAYERYQIYGAFNLNIYPVIQLNLISLNADNKYLNRIPSLLEQAIKYVDGLGSVELEAIEKYMSRSMFISSNTYSLPEKCFLLVMSNLIDVSKRISSSASNSMQAIDESVNIYLKEIFVNKHSVIDTFISLETSSYYILKTILDENTLIKHKVDKKEFDFI